MKFRFKLLAVVIIAVLTIIIYKFGVNENIEAEEEEKQSYYQTETVYLGYSDDAFTDFFTSAAVAFHEQNPDIRVIPKLIEDDEYIESINDLSVEGSEFPDVYVITNDTLEKAYLAGLASENTKSTNVVNDAHFPKAAISAVTYSDKQIGYPLFFETSVLVYNKTYLDEWVEKMKVEGVACLIYPTQEARREYPDSGAMQMHMEQIVETVNHELLPYKRIRKVFVLDEPMEMTSTKKIKRFAVVQKYKEMINA